MYHVGYTVIKKTEPGWPRNMSQSILGIIWSSMCGVNSIGIRRGLSAKGGSAMGGKSHENYAEVAKLANARDFPAKPDPAPPEKS